MRHFSWNFHHCAGLLCLIDWLIQQFFCCLCRVCPYYDTFASLPLWESFSFISLPSPFSSGKWSIIAMRKCKEPEDATWTEASTIFICQKNFPPWETSKTAQNYYLESQDFTVFEKCHKSLIFLKMLSFFTRLKNKIRKVWHYEKVQNFFSKKVLVCGFKIPIF